MANYNTKYVVRLTLEERGQLEGLVSKGRVAAGKRRRAQVLLKADATSEGSGLTDAEVAEALDVGGSTVHRVRKAFVEQGLEAAISAKPASRHRPRKLDGAAEAKLVALACSPPPEGRVCWTMQLLADRLVELEVVASISDDTVHRTLKKTSLSRG
jgi:transposase